MIYRVGRKKGRVILDENGRVVATCEPGQEHVARQICNLLNTEVAEVCTFTRDSFEELVEYTGGAVRNFKEVDGKYTCEVLKAYGGYRTANEGDIIAKGPTGHFFCVSPHIYSKMFSRIEELINKEVTE